MATPNLRSDDDRNFPPVETLIGRSDRWQPTSWSRVTLIATVFALLVAVVGLGLDWYLLRERRETWVQVLEISDVLSGVIAGGLAFRILAYERERRRRLQQKLEVIAEMNHHVRNALQLIQLSTYSTADREQMLRVREGIDRIQWALKEVLPKM